MDKQNKFCFTIGVLYDFTRLFLAKLLFPGHYRGRYSLPKSDHPQKVVSMWVPKHL